MFIDTHCHLPLMVGIAHHDTLPDSVRPALTEALATAQRQHVSTIITIGTTLEDSQQALTCTRWFDNVYATVGLHPTEPTSNWQQTRAAFQGMIEKDHRGAIVAIGECGVDLYHQEIPLGTQQDRFRSQIELALQFDKALVIHSRNAAAETLSCLDEFRTEPLRAVMHCFSYDLAIAQELIERAIYLGIGGTITYPKNESLRTVVQTIPLEYLLLETDAPFLAPQLHRGQQNHPAYIPLIAEHIAQIKGIAVATIAITTTQSAQKIFRCPPRHQTLL